MVKDKTNKANANCNQVILDHFWHICESSEDKRCKSIEVILNTLSNQITNHQNNDISYCLDRVVSGIVSAREFARHGFCVLLTEMLIRFKEHTNIEEIICKGEKEYGKFIVDAHPEKAISWSLLIGCLLKSGRITIDLEEEVLTKLFDLLFNLGSKKNYIEIMVCNLVQLFYDIFINDEEIFDRIVLRKIQNNYSECENSLFYAFLILLAHQKYSSVTKTIFNKFISQNIYQANSKEYIKVINLIKETTKYHPNIHPINNLIIKTMIQMEPKNTTTFYSETVEDILKIKLEKTSLGFEVIRLLLQNANPEQIEVILSPQFMRIFIQTLSNKKHPLHSRATELGNYFVQFSSQNQDNSAIQVSFAKCFINKPGSINFDELSKSRILSGILKHFNNKSIQEWICMLKEIMINQENIPTSDFYRIKCLQQISHLLKLYNQIDDFLHTITRFIFVYAYFDISGTKTIAINTNYNLEKFKSPLSERFQKLFAESFKSIFTHLFHLATLNITSSNEKLLKQIELLTSFTDFISKLIVTKKIKLFNVEDSVSEKIKQKYDDIKENLEKISTLNDNSVKSNVFKLLYLHFLIVIFENFQEIFSVLPDFDECANRALFVKNKHNKSKVKTGEPVWSDVLTELFLSLLATKSKHTKNIITIAFKHISPYLTKVGIESLTQAILDKDAFNADDSDDDDMDDEEEISPEMENNDVKMNSNENSTDESESEDDIMEQDDGEVDEQFKNNVIKALGKAFDNDDSDSECLSDSEMFKLDDSLAEVFRQKFGQKKRDIERQNMIQIFKHRVLELIQILIDHKELSLDLVCLILSSVVSFAKSNYALKSMSGVTNKCIQIFDQICKKRSFSSESANISQEEIKTLLELLIDFQYKCSNAELQKSLAGLTSWLLSVSQNILPDIQLFKSTIDRALKDFFVRPNTELKATLFVKLIPQLVEIEQQPFLKSSFYSTILEFAFQDGIRAFKRSSALDMFCSIFKVIDINKENCLSIVTDLTIMSLNQLVEETGNISNLKKNAKTPSNKEFKIHNINLLIKLLYCIHGFEIKYSKIDTLKRELTTNIDSLPKEVRKKLDKRFTKQFKNV